jgi:hypothetical protein
MKPIMEGWWNDTDKEKQIYSEKNLSQDAMRHDLVSRWGTSLKQTQPIL